MHRITDTHTAMCAALELYHESPNHRDATVGDLYRTLVPSIQLQQFLCFTQHGQPWWFSNWAFLSDEVAEGFRNRTRLLQPEDFPRTDLLDQLWVINLLAPHGDAPEFTRVVADHLVPWCRYGLYTRINPDGSVRRVGRITARRLSPKYSGLEQE